MVVRWQLMLFEQHQKTVSFIFVPPMTSELQKQIDSEILNKSYADLGRASEVLQCLSTFANES